MMMRRVALTACLLSLAATGSAFAQAAPPGARPSLGTSGSGAATGRNNDAGIPVPNATPPGDIGTAPRGVGTAPGNAGTMTVPPPGGAGSLNAPAPGGAGTMNTPASGGAGTMRTPAPGGAGGAGR
ncbi:MAG TPA: hypothetical protein VJR47_05405 [Stellaceae bacterium]|nr:hypothetical protein [Stellaceae bacterium]